MIGWISTGLSAITAILLWTLCRNLAKQIEAQRELISSLEVQNHSLKLLLKVTGVDIS